MKTKIDLDKYELENFDLMTIEDINEYMAITLPVVRDIVKSSENVKKCGAITAPDSFRDLLDKLESM